MKRYDLVTWQVTTDYGPRPAYRVEYAGEETLPEERILASGSTRDVLDAARLEGGEDLVQSTIDMMVELEKGLLEHGP